MASGSAPLGAVLFDMDGLLIDSERLWLDAESEIVGRLGGRWGPEHQEALVGGSVHRASAYMLELTGADVAPDEVARWLLDAMVTRLRAGVEFLPGAEALLADVTAVGVPCALVTSSFRVLADAALESIGASRFAATITGDAVQRLKPAPDPYLAAATALGVEPARCVALEDSPNGVASAEAAGCVTVAVPGVVPVPPRRGRIVVESLRELDAASLQRLAHGQASTATE